MGAEIFPEEAPSAADHSAGFPADALAPARAGAAAGRPTARSTVLRKKEAQAPARLPQVQSGSSRGQLVVLVVPPESWATHPDRADLARLRVVFAFLTKNNSF